jgi:glutaryl-CoA dehydrogenase (non-decarboxylating)
MGEATECLSHLRKRGAPRPPYVGAGQGGGVDKADGDTTHMISFELSEEHKAVEKMVRDWAAAEVAPKIHDLDREHRFERKFLKDLAAQSVLGICIPEEYGGAGMDYLSLGLACEELEYADTHLRVIMSVHVGLNSMTLWSWGTEAQKKKYLVPQAKGEKIATYGLTEPNAGSDAVGIQTTAVKKGDRYVLNGEKTWISLADVADHFLVIAWTDQEKKKNRDHSGLSAFIVERTFKGFSSYTMKEKWGILAGNTGGFHLEDVEVPAENLVGQEGEGFKVAMFALENGRYTVAAGATGLIRACLDASVKYARERKTFGQAIGEHQLVKEMIAEMVSDYDAARLLWLRAGWLKNEGKRNTRETGLAKWFATVKSERAASDCVQIHGGNGYSDEYPAGRFFRNSKAAVIYEGTREIHKLMQADYALGFRQDKPRRVELAAYKK